jgi:hypothetical protein
MSNPEDPAVAALLGQIEELLKDSKLLARMACNPSVVFFNTGKRAIACVAVCIGVAQVEEGTDSPEGAVAALQVLIAGLQAERDRLDSGQGIN